MTNSASSRIKEKVRHLPQTPGVYLMKDRFGKVLYVGKAINLRKRVSSYFQPSRRMRIEQPKVRAMIDLIHDVDIVEVRSEAEALLLEGRLIKEWKPRYNTDFTDDKRFLLIKVDLHSELPRFRLTRNRLEDTARYFGPFAHSGLVRQTLAEMRRRFGILLGDAQPVRLDDGRYRLYSDVRAELYGHPNEITRETYQRRVQAAIEFLEGKSKEWLIGLQAQMQQAAEAREYEKAARLRDIVRALEQTLSPDRRFTRLQLPTQDNRTSMLQELADALELSTPPSHMECFDISHISGTFCVASMVRFSGGIPDKKNYRHYRIQSFAGNDDFRAMYEVVSRRYRRLVRENSALPDLILIDGGKGQVNAAIKAFNEHGIAPPPLFGLAKKNEAIVFADERPDLVLPRHHGGLRLLQMMRDEAHRSANRFNAHLRKRKLRESILDEFKGLGPKRKGALLSHFGSIDKLRQATVEEIQAVPGFGPRMASDLYRFLADHTRQTTKAQDLFGKL